MKKTPVKPSEIARFIFTLALTAPVFAEPSLPPASVVINPPSRGGLMFEPMPGGKAGNPISAGNAGSEDVYRKQPVLPQKATPAKTAPPAKPIEAAKPAATAKPAAPAKPAVPAKTATPANTVAPMHECAAGAITCIELSSTTDRLQARVPTTFGQPFRMGDWQHRQEGLAAKDNLGNAVPLQFDQISSHQDGSARFAVLSTEVKNLQPQERRVVSIFPAKAPAKSLANATVAAPSYKVEATIYHPQVTLVRFGNRNGHTPGIAFAEGEQITLTLSGPVTERYSIALTALQAGGSHTTLTRIAETFMQAVNSHSKIYQVEKPGGGYEDMWIKTRDPEGGSFQAKVDYSGPAKIQVTVDQEFQKPQVWTAQTQAQGAGTKESAFRLNGAVVSEKQLVLPFRSAATGAEHPHLVARLDTRMYAESGAVWTDAVFENNWTFKNNPGNLYYKLTIHENGKLVHDQPPFTHYHHARWHKAFWAGTAPHVQLRHHMSYFMSSAAVWNYDLSLSVPEKVLEAEASKLQKLQEEQQDLGPMKNMFIQTFFPGTGGRAEIAPLPRWTALYLVTQDPRAYASMMANADASAAVPVHYRDEKTDQPVDPISHPALTLYQGGNAPHSDDRTIWSPDTAHQGSFTYVPYLVTGDRFYLDEMLFWATWNIISFPVDYRSKEKAHINRQQVRGQAWVLRALGEADRSMPDNHASKTLIKTILSNNLSWYKSNYVDDGKGSLMGFIGHSNTSMSTWQNDFLVTVFALLAENKEPKAKEIHAWLSRFSVGRFLADDEGFCAARASGYYWKTTDPAGKALTNWNEFFKINYPDDVGKPCASLVVTGGYPNSGAGYAAYARGMLGASANAGYKDADRAYDKWKSLTPGMDRAFEGDPSWAIVPRQ